MNKSNRGQRQKRKVSMFIWIALVLLCGVAGASAWSASERRADALPRDQGEAKRHTDSGSWRRAPSRSKGSIGANYAVKSLGFRGVVIHPSPWHGVIFNSQLYVRTGVDWCTGYRMPWIDRIHRIDQGERVILTAYVAYPWPSRPGRAELCGGLDLMLEEAIPVEELGGETAIYDGVVWPPIERISHLTRSAQ